MKQPLDPYTAEQIIFLSAATATTPLAVLRWAAGKKVYSKTSKVLELAWAGMCAGSSPGLAASAPKGGGTAEQRKRAEIRQRNTVRMASGVEETDYEKWDRQHKEQAEIAKAIGEDVATMPPHVPDGILIRRDEYLQEMAKREAQEARTLASEDSDGD
jgi:hypothetical protein